MNERETDAPVRGAPGDAGGREGGRGVPGDGRDDGNVLLDSKDDHWEWRRRIRADPHKHRIYRVVVGVVGTLLIFLGAATGWLPGPGGIPLVLAGLAVLASEFEWAHRLLQWAKHQLQHGGAWLRRQPRWVSWVGGILTLVCIGAAIWFSLALFGYPGWTPDGLADVLNGLPAVDPAG